MWILCIVFGFLAIHQVNQVKSVLNIQKVNNSDGRAGGCQSKPQQLRLLQMTPSKTIDLLFNVNIYTYRLYIKAIYSTYIKIVSFQRGAENLSLFDKPELTHYNITTPLIKQKKHPWKHKSEIVYSQKCK